MAGFLALVFCAATGFTIAGAVASFYQLITAKPPQLLTTASGVAGNVAAVLLTMLGGPFIITRKVIDGVRARELALLPATLGLLGAGMWSVVGGIFFLGLLVAA